MGAGRGVLYIHFPRDEWQRQVGNRVVTQLDVLLSLCRTTQTCRQELGKWRAHRGNREGGLLHFASRSN